MLGNLAQLVLEWSRACVFMLTAQHLTRETWVSTIDSAASSSTDADYLGDTGGSPLSGVAAKDLMIGVHIMERMCCY